MTNATGGIISYANGKKIHTFTESGTFSVTEAGSADSLVVGGGGAGGGDYSHTNTAFGGGGGGGVIATTGLTLGIGNVTVVVGEGGVPVLVSGGTIVAAENSSISDGNINFTTQTAIGGGTHTQNGGSGGGGSGSNGTGGTGTVGQGNDGGDVTNFFTGAAGGGGAGAAGGSAPVVDFTDTAGSGGAGLLSSISGTALRYGAGGGGGAWQDGYGAGGLGGGGDGGANNEAGKAGTFYGAGGGGQGGTTPATRTGGAGHKGVVIFSYDSDFTTGRRVAQNEDLADMAASTIKGRITTDGIPQDLNASEVAGILALEITERAQDAIGAMVADTATIDITYTDATPELKADVKTDSINDTHIDWGTGTNQVNLDDVPDGSTYVKITATNHTDLTDGGNTTLHTHGIYGLLSGTLAQFAATTSLELKGVISDETGTGALVFGTSPTLTAPVIGNFFYANHTHAASGVTGGTLASATGLPLTTGVTGILPAANGGTGIDNSTRTLTISTNAGTISFSAAASTLTVPATGTAALLATANVFTTVQEIAPASPTDGTDLMKFTTERAWTLQQSSTAGNAMLEFFSDTAGKYVRINPNSNTAGGLIVADSMPTGTLERFMVEGTGDIKAQVSTLSTTGYAFFRLKNDAASVANFGFFGSARAGTLFGINQAGLFAMYGSVPMVVGTSDTNILTLGQNNAARVSVGALVTNQVAVNYAADAQASDTYVITLTPALLAYSTGLEIIFKANTANTGAATLNVNGLGAKTIVKAVSTALANNDILAGMFCKVIYDGTNFVLMNPRAL